MNHVTGPNDPDEVAVRRVFDQPPPLLPPRPGTWDHVQHSASRRRRARAAGALATLAVVALVAGGAVGLLRSNEARVVTPQPAGPTVTVHPSPTTSGTGSATTAPGAAALPAGGPVPSGFRPASITSTAGGYWYVLGDAPCASPPCTSLVRSADQGSTWAGVPAPRAALAPAPGGARGNRANTVAEVRFASPQDGWAFGGALYATHNGGATWTRVNVPGQVADLATDGTTVWVVLAGCDGNTACPAGQLLQGKATGGPLAPVGSVHLAGHAYDARLSLAGRSGTLLVSTDAGPQVFVLKSGSWTALSGTICPSQASAGSAYIGGLVAVAVNADDPAALLGLCGDPGAGNVALAVAVSRDGGHTWRPVGQATLRVPNRLVGFTANASSVIVSDGSPDLGGALRVSRDGGATWTDARVNGNSSGGFAWRWVGASGGAVVLAVPLAPDGAVYLSTDGGLSFTTRAVR